MARLRPATASQRQPTARGARLVEIVADQHELGARAASPHGSRSSSEVRIPARSTKPRRGSPARCTKPFARTSRVAERLDHREHALADERRVVGERHRDQLVAVVMAAVLVRASCVRLRRPRAERRAARATTRSSRARPRRRRESSRARHAGRARRGARGSRAPRRPIATSSFASSTRSAAIACARASSRSPSAARAGLGIDDADHAGADRSRVAPPRACRDRIAARTRRVQARRGSRPARRCRWSRARRDRAASASTISVMPSHRSFLISTLQHTQPPASSSTSPPRPTISCVSIEIRPSSLTSTAIRLPCRAPSMRLSAVVLPAPSQPRQDRERDLHGCLAFEQRALDDVREHLAHERPHDERIRGRASASTS